MGDYHQVNPGVSLREHILEKQMQTWKHMRHIRAYINHTRESPCTTVCPHGTLMKHEGAGAAGGL